MSGKIKLIPFNPAHLYFMVPIDFRLGKNNTSDLVLKGCKSNFGTLNFCNIEKCHKEIYIHKDCNDLLAYLNPGMIRAASKMGVAGGGFARSFTR